MGKKTAGKFLSHGNQTSSCAVLERTTKKCIMIYFWLQKAAVQCYSVLFFKMTNVTLYFNDTSPSTKRKLYFNVGNNGGLSSFANPRYSKFRVRFIRAGQSGPSLLKCDNNHIYMSSVLNSITYGVKIFTMLAHRQVRMRVVPS
uniref:Uncharacterized protein n=1 Tax=Cucumis melo TaxID=3656 RepID=A0A9I9E8T8_CUCME